MDEQIKREIILSDNLSYRTNVKMTYLAGASSTGVISQSVG